LVTYKSKGPEKRKEINVWLIKYLPPEYLINQKLIEFTFLENMINYKLILSPSDMKKINRRCTTRSKTPAARPSLARLASMPRPVRESPWRALFKLAAQQEGLFSARQAKESGCSLQLLERYVAGGRVEKIQRALYRVVDFPAGEHEGLLGIWLWTRSEGVFSHETALFLHNLSDALPIRAHVTVPATWKTRKIKIPDEVALYHADLPEDDRTWIGPLPVTTVRRTLADCLHGSVASELVAQAAADAAQRGLITAAEVWSAPSIDLFRRGARP
jgi:hypothetical protein